MRFIFIPEMSVFSCAMDDTHSQHPDSALFLNELAIKRGEKGHKIASIPLSLINKFNKSQFFKRAKTIELVSEFIHIDESVCSENLEADYFEVARVNADKEPIIVTNGIDHAEFRAGHTTPVMSVEEALKLLQDAPDRF